MSCTVTLITRRCHGFGGVVMQDNCSRHVEDIACVIVTCRKSYPVLKSMVRALPSYPQLTLSSHVKVSGRS